MKKNINNILEFFDLEKIENFAKKNCFVKRKSYISGSNFLLAFTTGALQIKDLTLNKLSTFINNATSINISPQAIDKRINENSVNFMKDIFNYALSIMSSELEIDNDLVNKFSHIYISDSTSFQLNSNLKTDFSGIGGSASDSLMKIQYTFDYISSKSHIKIGDNTNSDAPYLENLIENNNLKTFGNSLFLQDLGYLKGNTFKNIDNNKDFFISKIRINTHLYDISNDNEINIMKILHKKETIDMKIKFGNKKFRLIGIKLNKKDANKKIAKAQKKAKSRGKKLKKNMKTFLAWNLFITNLDENYDFKTLYILYKIRWQIELHFKTWKSILKINEIKNIKNKNRVMCEIYGKLIIAFLLYDFNNLIKSNYKIDISYYKIMTFFSVIAIMWASNIYIGKEKNKKFLINIELQIKRQCKKNKQKNKLSIDFLLKQIEVNND